MKNLAIICLLGASAFKLKQEPVQPTCVYVDKASGVERDCSAPGNSAWVDNVPYVPIEKNPDYKRNFFAKFYFMESGTGQNGYNLAGLAADKVDEIPNINYKSDNDFVGTNYSQQRDKFAMEIEGVFDIKESGTYTFWTRSDDGSRLWVDGALMVDNWGLHGARDRSGHVDLHQGIHSIKVSFFENFGGANLIATYAGPDTKGERSLIEGYHEEENNAN